MQFRRIKPILFSVLAQFATPVTRIFLSLAVIRLYSNECWGAYVQYYLVITLCMVAVNWGSRDFLLRAFSREPQAIQKTLSGSMAGKTAIALAVVLVLWLTPVPFNKALIALWIGGQLSWQFFESLNTYRRLFLQASLAELGLTGMMIAVILSLPMTITGLLALFIVSEWAKGLVFAIFNRKYLAVKWISFRSGLAFLKDAAPFLLVVLTGAAAARGDLYMLALKMDEGHLAQYQVLSNFIQSGHLLASAILLPFIKNLYRLPKDSVYRLERRFLQAGLLMTPLLVLFIYGVVHFGYGFRFYATDYLLSAGLILTYFLYFIRMQMAYRQNRLPELTIIL
ncbi:MAG TPA: hypothetical protein PKE06_14100, partial [Flavilitoribacter sp.]|nr:hypothetical protein [Flavilitoribacter sp.]